MSSPWSADERRAIASKLAELLAPETVNAGRTLDNGRQQYYLKIAQARALANDIFGEDHWRTELRWCHTDEETAENGSHAVAVSCAVRVTLRDGSFHEDVGFCAATGADRPEAMRKARSIAATDATKRALRLFGPALGNCLYDASFTHWLAQNPTTS